MKYLRFVLSTQTIAFALAGLSYYGAVDLWREPYQLYPLLCLLGMVLIAISRSVAINSRANSFNNDLPNRTLSSDAVHAESTSGA